MSDTPAPSPTPSPAPRLPSRDPLRWLLWSAIFCALGAVSWSLYQRLGSDLSGTSGPMLVMVDLSRIVNAQRAAVNEDPAEGSLAALKAGKVIESTIREIAGPGTVVLVKQAVVTADASVRDITEEVLQRLDLPLDASAPLRYELLPSHALTPQGQALMEHENRRTDYLGRVAQEAEAERIRENSLIP